MSRFELGGKGDPIPLIALPDPNLDENLPAQLFVLENGVPFNKTDWVGLGYTHYEVWCIGAAGGQGGGANNNIFWRATRNRVTLTTAEWTRMLQIDDYWARQLTPPYGPYFPQDQSGLFAYVEANNPGHLSNYISNFFDAFLQDTAQVGGGGGGGGLEVASGLLADLGTETAVVVGAPGVDAIVGHTNNNGIWTPDAYTVSSPTWTSDPVMQANQMWYDEFHNEYPAPHKSFANPLPGGDGGYSSFGGSICRASGGKGGQPAYVWNGSAFVLGGAGGAGGKGGRTTAGGGAAGSAAEGVNGSDGVWDGTIGEGGGGGHAGRFGSPGSSFPYVPPEPYHSATAGGRGAFSYSDTSVFGDREPATPGGARTRMVDYYTGAITSDVFTPSGVIAKAGGGGGARAFRNINRGSKAPTFDPAGTVVIRLTAVL